jgi:hypothetical protein
VIRTRPRSSADGASDTQPTAKTASHRCRPRDSLQARKTSVPYLLARAWVVFYCTVVSPSSSAMSDNVPLRHGQSPDNQLAPEDPLIRTLSPCGLSAPSPLSPHSARFSLASLCCFLLSLSRRPSRPSGCRSRPSMRFQATQHLTGHRARAFHKVLYPGALPVAIPDDGLAGLHGNASHSDSRHP